MLYAKRVGRFLERLANPDEQAHAPKGVLLYSPSLLRLVAVLCYAIWVLGYINNFVFSDFFRRSFSDEKTQQLFYSQTALVIVGAFGTGLVVYFARTRYRGCMLVSSMLAVSSGMLASVYMYGFNVNPHMLLAITPLLLIGFTVGRDGLLLVFGWIVANYMVLYLLDTMNVWPQPDGVPISVVRHENLSAFIILLLIVLAIEFYIVKIAVTLRRQGELHDALEKEQQKRLDLQSRLLFTKDEERRQLAHILHEGPVQDLVAVKLGLFNGMDRKHLVELVDRITEDLRTTSRDLHPADLELHGLCVALNNLAGRQGQNGSTLEVGVSCPRSLCCDKQVARVLYRIAQEALINARKHSGAQHASIHVNQTDQAITLEVRDDGHGFDVQPAKDRAAMSGHLGLVTLDELTRSVMGEIAILSSAEAGTTIRVSVPAEPLAKGTVESTDYTAKPTGQNQEGE